VFKVKISKVKLSKDKKVTNKDLAIHQ